MTWRSFCIVFLLHLCVGLAAAQEKPDPPCHERNVPLDYVPCDGCKASEQETQLVRAIELARRAGEADVAAGLHAELMRLKGITSMEAGFSFAEMPEQAAAVIPQASPALWGNDTRIFPAAIDVLSIRGVATAVGPDGAIYVASSFKPSPTGFPTVYVYKSTDNGLSWLLVNGTVYNGRRVQGFSLSVTDSADLPFVGLVTSFSEYDTRYDGDLYWTSFLGDGTHWRTQLIKGHLGGRGFMDPSVVSDGFNYPTATTGWYAAAAWADSNGRSSGLMAFRSTDWGLTWPAMDTIRMSFLYSDLYPTIEYSNAYPDAESVFVAAEVDFDVGVSDIRLFRQRASFGGTGGWEVDYLTTDSLRDVHPDLAIGRGDGKLFLCYSRPYPSNSSDHDILYFVCIDRVWGGPRYAASLDLRDERWSSIDVRETSGSTAFVRLGWTLDNVEYQSKTAWDFPRIGSAPRARVGNRPPTTSHRIEVGSHGAGGLGETHAVYVDSGLSGVYFNAAWFTSVGRESPGMPIQCSLGQNFPNPFNPSTTIGFNVGGFRGQGSGARRVTLKVYDILGREVATLADEEKNAGMYTVHFDGSGLAGGVYFYRLCAGGFSETRRLLLLR